VSTDEAVLFDGMDLWCVVYMLIFQTKGCREDSGVRQSPITRLLNHCINVWEQCTNCFVSSSRGEDRRYRRQQRQQPPLNVRLGELIGATATASLFFGPRRDGGEDGEPAVIRRPGRGVIVKHGSDGRSGHRAKIRRHGSGGSSVMDLVSTPPVVPLPLVTGFPRSRRHGFWPREVGAGGWGSLSRRGKDLEQEVLQETLQQLERLISSGHF